VYDVTPVACRGYGSSRSEYPTPAIRFTLGAGVREFRDSDDVLRILPFVVRHAQRRAHSKSADAVGLRIPERAIARDPKEMSSEVKRRGKLRRSIFSTIVNRVSCQRIRSRVSFRLVSIR